MHFLFAKRFRKTYTRLPKQLQKRCDERLLIFEKEPFHILLNNHLLYDPYAGCRSINIIGDYRAIFYHESPDVVRFIAVGTHHELFGT